MRNTLFQNLHYPFSSTTNGNKEGDLLNLARAANLYYPKTLKNATNKKGNLERRRDKPNELCKKNYKLYLINPLTLSIV